MDLKRWRVPMSFMMLGVGIANGQGSQASGNCYECAWLDEVCVPAPAGDWGSTSCVGESQGYDECNMSETQCTAGNQ